MKRTAQSAGLAPLFVAGQANDRERRVDSTRELEVVETDDGNFRRYQIESRRP